MSEDRDIKPENVIERREVIDRFVDDLEVRRRRGLLRLVPRPLAHCRAENDQGHR